MKREEGLGRGTASLLIGLVSLAALPFTAGLSIFGLAGIPVVLVKGARRERAMLPTVRGTTDLGFHQNWPASEHLFFSTPESPETAIARLEPWTAAKLLQEEGKRRLSASVVSDLREAVTELSRQGYGVDIETTELCGFFGGVRGHRTTIRKRG